MKKPDTAPKLRTPGVLAEDLGQPLHRVLYVLRSRQQIRPTARAGRLRLFDREAAKALGISERMLWSLTAPRGTIPAVRIGTCVLYPVSGLQAWLDRQAQGAPEGGRQ